MAMNSTPEDGEADHQRDIVYILVKHGADVNLQCPSRRGRDTQVYNSPVHLAAINGKLELLKILLSSPTANVNKDNTICK